MSDRSTPITALCEVANDAAREAIVNARNTLHLLADDLTRHVWNFHQAKSLEEKEDVLRAALYLLAVRLPGTVRLDRLAEAQASVARAAGGYTQQQPALPVRLQVQEGGRP